MEIIVILIIVIFTFWVLPDRETYKDEPETKNGNMFQPETELEAKQKEAIKQLRLIKEAKPRAKEKLRDFYMKNSVSKKC